MTRLSVLAALLFFSVMQNSEAYDRRVRVINDTSWTMTRFYASNVGRHKWEEDILGRDVLYPGQSIWVDIDDGSGYCRYDLKATFEDGDEVLRWDFNVCEAGSWTVYD